MSENKKANMIFHSNVGKLFAILIALLTLASAVLISCAVLLFLFPIQKIEILGNSRYSYSDIIEISDIEIGDRLYYLDSEGAEDRILQAFPHLESVSVHSYFPNRVKIEIEEYKDIYITYHTNGFCYLNNNFEVLEIIEGEFDFACFSGVFIEFENCISEDVGEAYFGDDALRAKELIEYLKNYGFYRYVNIIDVKEKYNNSFIVDKKHIFIMGSMTDIENKIEASFKVCFSDSLKHDKNYQIDATNKNKLVLAYKTEEYIRSKFNFCKK